MALERYPHTAIITTTASGSQSTAGVYTPGTTTTVSVTGRVEHEAGKYIINEHGDRIDYDITMYVPSSEGIDSSVNGGKLTYGGRDYQIVDVPPHQTHTEIRCGKAGGGSL
jgi:hypothetical protein